MSNSTKDLFDYNSVRKCSKCGTISLKSNFYKDSIKKDDYISECKFCSKEYYYVNRDWVLNNRETYVKKNRAKINAYEREKRKTDVN